jgi:competence protein ComEC
VETEKNKTLKFTKAFIAPMLFTLPIIFSVFGTVNLLSWLTTFVLGFIFTPFLIFSFISQITLLKVETINKITETLGILFIKGAREAFELTKFAIIHSELSIIITGSAFLITLYLILFHEGKYFLTPLLGLLLYGALNQTIVSNKTLTLEGWKVNSFRFVSTEGQRYRNCKIWASYLFPATKKLLFRDQLLDERVPNLERWVLEQK